MYDALKRHEVHVLRRAGLSIKDVAAKAGVGRSTVKRILNDEPVTDLDAPPAKKGRVGRPPVARAFASLVGEILEAEPDLPTVEVLRRAREKGYRGRKTAFYELVRELRPRIVMPMVRFEGVAGEFSQHDFGQVRVRYDDGTVEVVKFFASRLKWSRWAHVELTPNETVESVVRGQLAAFESFGGVPLVCVYDNPSTIVVSRKDNVIRWNDTFGQVALDYRFAPELCAPRRANQKGAVENLVGFVKNGFFKVRRFHDRADLETQLAQWLHEVNVERPCRATNVIPAARIMEERRRMRPLPVPASEYALRYPVRVGPTGWVEFEGIRYSMPAKAIGFNATLFLYPDEVRIVAGQYEATHPRHPFNGVSTLSNHATQMLAQVSGRRAELYYKRQRLLEVGGSAEAFLTELVHARSRTWSQDVERLFGILLERGPERLGRALGQALERGWYGSEHVERLVKQEVLSV